MTIAEIVAQYSFQMTAVQYDDMIQAISLDATNHAFDKGILSGASWHSEDLTLPLILKGSIISVTKNYLEGQVPLWPSTSTKSSRATRSSIPSSKSSYPSTCRRMKASPGPSSRTSTCLEEIIAVLDRMIQLDTMNIVFKDSDTQSAGFQLGNELHQQRCFTGAAKAAYSENRITFPGQTAVAQACPLATFGVTVRGRQQSQSAG